jgi:hypothetical protein
MSSDSVLKTYHIPPFLANDKTMPATVATYPPLGQVTRVSSRTVTFIAALDISVDEGESPWQVAIWHSTTADRMDDWQQTLLEPIRESRAPVVSLQNRDTKKRRQQYSGVVNLEISFGFTVKYRSGPDRPWIWVRDTGGVGDGTIIINVDVNGSQVPENLDDIIKDLNSELKVKRLSSQAPQTKLWSLEASVPAAQGDDSAILDVPLGIPWNGGKYVR